jgi:UDP-GlcNAc3NAcA epimerase
MKIVTIVGARPQIIKAAAVCRHFKALGIRQVLIHTGQHREAAMSDVFFNDFQMPAPHYNLGISGLQNADMVEQMMDGLCKILRKMRAIDGVLVFGDTTSTLSGAMAAMLCHLPIAHVEAGLRSYNKTMAEETCRVLTDEISRMMFCPTAGAYNNLIREGYGQRNRFLIQSGDVQYDLALQARERAVCPPDFPLTPGTAFLLCTIHRSENTDAPERLAQIVGALNDLHERTPVVLPVHPRFAKCLSESGLTCRFHTIRPTGYFQMQWLLMHADGVITDSGGLQKEAFFHKKTCVVWRKETEWTELVEHGATALSEPDAERTLDLLATLRRTLPDCPSGLFGAGDAGWRIALELQDMKGQEPVIPLTY